MTTRIKVPLSNSRVFMLTRYGPSSWRRLLQPEVSAWMTLLAVIYRWQQYRTNKTSVADFAVFTFEKSDDAMMFVLRWL